MITDNNRPEQTKTDTLKTGYIYCIRSFQTENIYIGSTFQRLSKRFYEHKQQYKYYKNNNASNYCSSYKMLDYNDAYIELLKEVQVNNRQELYKHEGDEQRKNKNILINCFQANPTAEERKAQRRKSKLKHKEKNKEKVKEYNKKYRKENKDYYKDYSKKYVQVRKNKKYKCLDCNIEINYKSRLDHFKSKKHLKHVNNKEKIKTE